jgi:membrane protein insertase, YidC/Oxa1 family, N-terminal domain
MEKRLLLAFFLSALIFIVWSALFPPPQKTKAGPAAAGAEKPAAGGAKAAPAAAEKAAAQPAAPAGPAVAGEREQQLVLENAVVHLSLDNRGAAITSLILKRYDDDEGRPLDLVQRVDLPQRALPLQLVDGGRPDGRLYAVERIPGGYRFRWSDGSAEVEKTIRLAGDSYRIGFSVVTRGAAPPPTVAVGTGMRNIGRLEVENRFATWGNAIVYAGGEMTRFKRKKVEAPEVQVLHGPAFAGFEDTYFLNVMRLAAGDETVRIVPLTLPVSPAAAAARPGARKKRKRRRVTGRCSRSRSRRPVTSWRASSSPRPRSTTCCSGWTPGWRRPSTSVSSTPFRSSSSRPCASSTAWSATTAWPLFSSPC